MSAARTITMVRPGVHTATWASLLTAETGDAADLPLEAATRSIQVSGVPGAGGAIAIQGSNDGVIWQTLTNGFDAALTTAGALATLPAIEDIMQNVRFIRPVVTGGDGTTNLKVVLVAA